MPGRDVGFQMALGDVPGPRNLGSRPYGILGEKKGKEHNYVMPVPSCRNLVDQIHITTQQQSLSSQQPEPSSSSSSSSPPSELDPEFSAVVDWAAR